MRHTASKLTITSAFLSMLAFSGGAAAQATWDFGAACNPANCLSAGNPAGINVNVRAFGTTSTTASYTETTSMNQGLSGIGAQFSGETSSGGHHAFDNDSSVGGRVNEVLLMTFNGQVNLNQVKLGWRQNDADMLVYRWDQATAPNLSSTAGTNALKNGWTLVSAMDVDTNGVNQNTMNFTGGRFSSWWLISTFFDGATTNTPFSGVTGLDTSSKDYFKILSFSGAICPSPSSPSGPSVASCGGGGGGGSVPEPGSLALAAAGLLGAFGIRRRVTKKAA